jgi:signal transduction histidine kinase
VRSLRGRLALGVVVVLAAVLVVAGLLASREVDRSERSAFDDRLRRTAELSRATALAAVQEQLPEDDRRLDAVLSASGSSLRLLLGKTVLLDTGAPPPRRPKLPLGLHTFRSTGVDYRSYVTTLRDRDLGGLARLEVVSSLASLESRQSRLDRRLAALGALTLLVAGIGAWLAAGLVLRPLARLRGVASSVADEEDLGRRVPADDGPAELRSLAASFNAMLGRLGRSSADRERALEATRRFAADAGHVLSTPLTTVKTTLSSMRRHQDMPAEQRAGMVDEALNEQRRLVALLDGLQALARGDAGPLEQTDVDLGEVVDGVATAARERHPGVEVITELPGAPVVVRGWEPGLRLLVDNLVENAARHGRADGRVVVTLEETGPTLHVDDDGPGIPEDERDRIFAPFVRATDSEHPGSGLGLALVAQQARHHGATVTVGEAPIGGARLTVRF